MTKKELEGKRLEKNVLDVYNRIAAKARDGDLESCFIVGMAFAQLPTFRDDKKAFNIFEDLAGRGYRPGKMKLAEALFYGTGVKRNFLESYKLFAELADDDSNIKDICIAWASFEFNNKFVKEMKSAAKCKKGSWYVENAIFNSLFGDLDMEFSCKKDYMKLSDEEYAYRRFYDPEGTADILISKDDIDMSTIAQLYHVDDEGELKYEEG